MAHGKKTLTDVVSQETLDRVSRKHIAQYYSVIAGIGQEEVKKKTMTLEHLRNYAWTAIAGEVRKQGGNVDYLERLEIALTNFATREETLTKSTRDKEDMQGCCVAMAIGRYLKSATPNMKQEELLTLLLKKISQCARSVANGRTSSSSEKQEQEHYNLTSIALDLDSQVTGFCGYKEVEEARDYLLDYQEEHGVDLGLEYASKSAHEEVQKQRQEAVDNVLDNPDFALTEKQKLYLTMASKGLHNVDIAKICGVTESTVATTLTHARRKISGTMAAPDSLYLRLSKALTSAMRSIDETPPFTPDPAHCAFNFRLTKRDREWLQSTAAKSRKIRKAMADLSK